MNPHRPHPVAPWAAIRTITTHRDLVAQLIRREVVGRYRGSMLGLAWSFFNPLLMLSIYTFMFTVVFKARWSGDAGDVEQGKAGFAILVLVGLIVHGLFAECMNRAPTLVLSNVNYVKKVIFPLELLTVVSLGSATFHAAISLVVLLGAEVLLLHGLPWTVVLFPLVLVPLLLASAGCSWLLASLGVYLRDVAQVTSVLTNVLLFLSPVFYPVSALPESLRPLMALNPLTTIIEDGRDTLVFGRVPDPGPWALVTAGCALLAWIGFATFQKTRRGFADVL